MYIEPSQSRRALPSVEHFVSCHPDTSVDHPEASTVTLRRAGASQSALRTAADPAAAPECPPAENGFFEPFIYKNDHFAKTGSGQT
jgi:hypothetical protein